MSLQGTIEKALNDQIANELQAAYQYLAMAAYFTRENLDGFARWMMAQREEEVGHAMRIFDYVNDRDARVELGRLEKPQSDFDSPLDAFEHAYEHERSVTKQIHALFEKAADEKDYPTQTLLQWFITEQVEEEATALHIVEQLKMVGDSSAGLLMLDRELGARGPDDE